jgi:hypothetical protein
MQKKRAILRAFEARLSQSHERLLATFHIAVRTHLPEDQQKREKVLALTGALKVPMESLLRECQDLFFLGIRALDEGVDAVKGDVTQNAVEVRSAIQTLSQEFRTAKAAAQKRGRQAIDGDLLEESALCMNLCALGRKVAEAAEEWAENKPLVEQGGFLGLGCMKDIFDRQTIFDPKKHQKCFAHLASTFNLLCVGICDALACKVQCSNRKQCSSFVVEATWCSIGEEHGQDAGCSSWSCFWRSYLHDL